MSDKNKIFNNTTIISCGKLKKLYIDGVQVYGVQNISLESGVNMIDTITVKFLSPDIHVKNTTDLEEYSKYG